MHQRNGKRNESHISQRSVVVTIVEVLRAKVILEMHSSVLVRSRTPGDR